MIEHLKDVHRWHDLGNDVVDGRGSSDPLGWHDRDGRYTISTSELLSTHRELHEALTLR